MPSLDKFAPPLPLSVEFTSGKAGAVKKNAWNLLVTSVPIWADPANYSHIRLSKESVGEISRSSLRTGVLEFTAPGLHIVGEEVVLNPSRAILAGWIFASLMVLYLASFIVGHFVHSLKFLQTFSGIFPLLALASRGIFACIANRRRAPTELFIPWADVVGVRMDAKRRWVALIYRTPILRIVHQSILHGTVIQQPGLCSLSLNRLDNSTVEGVATTVQHFAPQSGYEKIAERTLPEMRWIVAGASMILTLIAALLLFRLITP